MCCSTSYHEKTPKNRPLVRVRALAACFSGLYGYISSIMSDSGIPVYLYNAHNMLFYGCMKVVLLSRL